MEYKVLLKKSFFLKFLLKFLAYFCILYYGTIAVIGITSPEGFYSFFADHYLNYVSWLRWTLLHASLLLLKFFGVAVYLKDAYTIRMQNGVGVHVGYDCIGYGVMIFWLAFIVANDLKLSSKIKWIIGGLLMIWILNVSRISLMLIAVNQHWKSPFGFDNHTWFNLVAYLAIFTMMYFFDVAQKKHTRIEQVE